jgi:succinate-acetate transporter protein
LGGLIGGLSLVFLPWTGIQEAYLSEATSQAEGLLALNKALGILFLCAMIPIFLLFLASFKTAVPISFAAICIVVALILQGTAYLHSPMVTLTKACGALFIVIGIVLWYSATAVLLQEEGVKILPIGPLPRLD